ncbi:acetylcholine receptor subunit alpha-like [Aplysia californica]|uniref:Acetylcholine receptor subunit alpha-like n=1 Tax=Aplysia californica TaxID=6500 RepID=A0ABM1VXZ2_APLCA|nr:acetylcholine receptor subunit alpha-like [Aplysia californica]
MASDFCCLEIENYTPRNNINEVIESKQSVSSVVFFNVTWTDEDLAWDVEDYDNITMATAPPDRLWHPEIHVANTLDDLVKVADPYYLQLSSDGTVQFEVATTLRTTCPFDLTEFPFDTQDCGITMVLKGFDIHVRPSVDDIRIIEDGSLNLIFTKTEWTIESSEMDVLTLNNEKPLINLRVTIRRAHLYYTLCVILPVMITSWVSLLVFWIPPDSGEKMSFLVSNFVSLTLYFNFIGDLLPRNFTEAPKMGILFVYICVQCAVAMVITIVVMRKHRQEVLEAELAMTLTAPSGMAPHPDQLRPVNQNKTMIVDDGVEPIPLRTLTPRKVTPNTTAEQDQEHYFQQQQQQQQQQRRPKLRIKRFLRMNSFEASEPSCWERNIARQDYFSAAAIDRICFCLFSLFGVLFHIILFEW